MKLKIFEDKACDYMLHWLVCDTDKKDDVYKEVWLKEGWTLSQIESSYRYYKVIASFPTEEDAKNYVFMMNSVQNKFEGCSMEDFTKYATFMAKTTMSKDFPLKNKCGRIDCNHWRWDECQCKPGINTACHGCE